MALEAFEEKWGQQLPVIGQAWRSAWEHVTPFMAFEPEVRRVIYTTNAIEALNRQLRKAIKTKGSFPTEDSARKLIYLAIQNAVPQWTQNPRLDKGAARVQDPLRRPTTRLTTKTAYTERRTPSLSLRKRSVGRWSGEQWQWVATCVGGEELAEVVVERAVL